VLVDHLRALSLASEYIESLDEPPIKHFPMFAGLRPPY
jgi:hypothetical protein